MPKLNQAKSFWRIMKSVSLGEVVKESRRTFAIAVVGAPDRRSVVLRGLYPDMPDEGVHPLVRTFDSIAPEAGFPQETGSFDMVLDAGGGWSPPGTPIRLYSVVELGGWPAVVERVLDEHPDLNLSLARRFPGLREAVSQRIVRETATANAQFAMVNALPGIVPLLGILIPTAILGDLVFLAKNQAMMLYRLAAAHDLPLEARARAQDLAPLVGTAFGWRALARELIGFVPGGVGLVARGAVAYAGTMALGEAMRRMYAMGQRPTRAQIGALYRESIGQARRIASDMALRVRSVRPPRGLLRGREDED
ncbi:MAG: hypothetical protein FJX72_04890 [Armatimonadetes bacterium]|nr:hypothetical protein [Armatimonadota bacterium]